ncbi:MAG TPA: hypothetical protein VGK21_18555 [Candidatus Angelobacter sp.]|jgi:hypothetical protein
MKSLFLAASLLVMASPASVQNKPRDLGLPELHKIQKITLSPNYGCRTPEEFAQGYANTALFLSSYSRQRNSPELLFNGACGGPDYFTSATAGAQLDVISDFGEAPLKDLIASDVFGLHRTVDSMANFRQELKIQAGHTYAVLINKGDIHGFFFFQVLKYIPNHKLDLEYVVMNYSFFHEEQHSPGFDWSTKSYYDNFSPEIY